MSHAAIAAVLARDDLSAGERLVAWSLASFANREQRAWPGIPAAAARAGLSRSRYLELRDRLVRRGLLEIETQGVGRGHASTVKLLFAKSGPWQEDEVNAELLEAVLGYSRTRGPARLLLAALAALADENGNEGPTADELCRAASEGSGDFALPSSLSAPVSSRSASAAASFSEAGSLRGGSSIALLIASRAVDAPLQPLLPFLRASQNRVQEVPHLRPRIS